MEEKISFGIWRHEDSIGNSAEQVVALANLFEKNNINTKDVTIYVEHEWQKVFALCIKGITEENIKFFENKVDPENPNKELLSIHMPDVYGFEKNYPGNWRYLCETHPFSDVVLEFDEAGYENKFNLPKDSIILFHREKGTWWKRVDGSNFEKDRFVKPDTFHKLAFHYADQGYKVVKIGDKKQKKLPGKYSKFEFGEDHEHPNIIDFTKYLDDDGNPLWDFRDYLYLISTCQVFISCDAGIWPMAGGMRSNLLMANMTSIFGNPSVEFRSERTGTFTVKSVVESMRFTVKKPELVDWLPRESSEVLEKRPIVDPEWIKKNQELGNDSAPLDADKDVVIEENSFEEIVAAAEYFIE